MGKRTTRHPPLGAGGAHQAADRRRERIVIRAGRLETRP